MNCKEVSVRPKTLSGSGEWMAINISFYEQMVDDMSDLKNIKLHHVYEVKYLDMVVEIDARELTGKGYYQEILSFVRNVVRKKKLEAL